MKSLSGIDLKYYTSGVSDLEDYLLSDELFWNLPGQTMLTIGGLLLAQVNLESVTLKSEDQVVYYEAQRQMEYLVSKWRVAFENKVQREITSRLNLWQNYLADYWSAPDEYADTYAQEVRWRVMIQLLVDAVSGQYNEKVILQALDDRLKFSFLPGGFIWAEQLSGKLNTRAYWFLYGNLPGILTKKAS